MGFLSAWLVYDTTKIVRIQDKRLSILYYLLVLLITFYTFYSVVLSKGYFDHEQISGAISIHLVDNSVSKQPLNELEYCSDSKCVWWSESEVLVVLGTKEVMVTTHISSDRQQLICRDTEFGETCAWETIDGSESNYYIAGVDSMDIEIEHSAQAPIFHEQWMSNHDIANDDSPFAGNSRNMEGVLMNSRANKTKKILKAFHHEDPDRFSVAELLMASYTDLSGKHSNDETFREGGMALKIDIGYNNARCDGSLKCAFGTVPMHYRYRVYQIPNLHYSQEEINMLNSTLRDRNIRSGILIKVKQTGLLSRFSAQVFFMNFTAGLGLMALSGFIVDMIAIFVLPERKQYSHRKFSEVTKKGEKIKEN